MPHQQKDEIISWLQKTCPDAECSVCGAPFLKGSNIGLYLNTISLMDIGKVEGRYKTLGTGKSAICIVCNNCGHIIMFDAHKIGLI